MKFIAAALLVPVVRPVLGFTPFIRPVALKPQVASSTSLFEYGASSTSFYTTVEKQDTYLSLDDVLETKCADANVRQVIKDMLEACAEITELL